MYIDKSDDIVKKYSEAYHKTIKLNPSDEYSNANIDFGIKDIEERPYIKS